MKYQQATYDDSEYELWKSKGQRQRLLKAKDAQKRYEREIYKQKIKDARRTLRKEVAARDHHQQQSTKGAYTWFKDTVAGAAFKYCDHNVCNDFGGEEIP